MSKNNLSRLKLEKKSVSQTICDFFKDVVIPPKKIRMSQKDFGIKLSRVIHK